MSQQPPQWPPQDQYNAPLAYGSIAAPPNSGMAIASMVVGIGALVTSCFLPLLPGAIALVLGLVSLGRTGPGKLRGRGFAITGITTGSIALFFSLMLPISIVLPIINSGRESGTRVKCGGNMRQLGQAIRQYALDQDGHYPPDLDAILAMPGTTPAVLICPSSSEQAGTPAGPFTLGQNLSFIYIGGGLKDDVPATAVLMYEPVNNHDREGGNFLFADGSVRFILRQQARSMIQQLESGINPPDQNAPATADATGGE